MKSYVKLAAVLSVILAVSVFSLPSVRASETAVAVLQAPDQTAIQTISPEKKMKKEKKKTTQKQTKKNVHTEPASTEKADAVRQDKHQVMKTSLYTTRPKMLPRRKDWPLRKRISTSGNRSWSVPRQI